jgi:hypothetical protein
VLVPEVSGSAPPRNTNSSLFQKDLQYQYVIDNGAKLNYPSLTFFYWI